MGSFKKKKHHFIFKKKIASQKHVLKFSSLGLKLKYSVCINEKQEHLLKFFILKKIKNLVNKKIKLFFYLEKQFNGTSLPLESRMGKGKGEVVNSFGFYKAGFLIVELKNFNVSDLALLKFYLNKKFPFQFFIN